MNHSVCRYIVHHDVFEMPMKSSNQESTQFVSVYHFLCQQARTVAPQIPRIVLQGPRGSGKATQAALLAAKYGLVNSELISLLLLGCCSWIRDNVKVCFAKRM